MTKDVDLRIQGMSCGHCVKAVRGALENVPGVTKVDVEVGRARVVCEDSVSRDALAAAITDAGFEVG